MDIFDTLDREGATATAIPPKRKKRDIFDTLDSVPAAKKGDIFDSLDAIDTTPFRGAMPNVSPQDPSAATPQPFPTNRSPEPGLMDYARVPLTDYLRQSEAGKGFIRGTITGYEGLKGALQAAGATRIPRSFEEQMLRESDVFGAFPAPETPQTKGESDSARVMRQEPSLRPKVARVGEIKSVSDFGNWLASKAGEQAPYMATTWGAGAVAGALKGTKAALATAGAATGILEGGGAYSEMQERGQTVDDASKVRAAAVGAINGALEMIPFGGLIKRTGLFGKASKEATAKLLKDPQWLRLLKNTTKQAASESLTEGAQELTTLTGVYLNDNWRKIFTPEFVEEVTARGGEAMAAGGILGGATGMAGTAFGPTARAAKAQQQMPETIGKQPLKPTQQLPGPVPNQELDQGEYEANRLNKPPGMWDTAKRMAEQVGRAAVHVLGTTSTRLENIDPTLYLRARRYQKDYRTDLHEGRGQVLPAIQSIRKKLPAEAQHDFDLARKQGDAAKLQQIIIKYRIAKEYHAIRKTISRIGKAAEKVGLDFEFLKHYHPRYVRDLKGFWQYVQETEHWGAIQQVIQKKETKLQEQKRSPLTQEEKVKITNHLLSGFPVEGITLTLPRSAKARSVQRMTAGINKFYYSADESLLMFVDEMSKSIRLREMLGRESVDMNALRKKERFLRDKLWNVQVETTQGLFGEQPADEGKAAAVEKLRQKYQEVQDQIQAQKDITLDDSIGAYVFDLIAKQEIKPQDEVRVRDLIRDMAKPAREAEILKIGKDVAYVNLLANWKATLKQMEDFVFSLYKWGVIPTAKAIGRQARGKGKISVADLGIKDMMEEMSERSKMAKWSRMFFRLAGFSGVDFGAKTTFANAAVASYGAQARQNDPRLERRLNYIFQNDQNVIQQVKSDLAAEKVTPNVQLLVFNDMSDFYPLTAMEVPQGYNRAGNLRFFYMLKTYWTKLLDIYYREGIREIQQGNVVHGMRNIFALTMLLTAAGASVNELRAWLFGKKITIADAVLNKLLDIAGLNRYMLRNVKEQGVPEAIWEGMRPPTPIVDWAYQDWKNWRKGRPWGEIVRAFPVLGEEYYWWLGQGAKKSGRAFQAMPLDELAEYRRRFPRDKQAREVYNERLGIRKPQSR